MDGKMAIGLRIECASDIRPTQGPAPGKYRVQHEKSDRSPKGWLGAGVRVGMPRGAGDSLT